MTNASKGLGAALARGASGAVVALAEMTATDILGGVSDETRAALIASLAADTVSVPGSNADDATAGDAMPDEDCKKCGKAKKDGKCACADSGADADANAAATPLRSNASVHERVKAVAASAAAKANPAAALDLLADDEFVSLSADAVIKLVGKAAPAAGASDDGVGRQMLANMQNDHADLGADNTSPKAEANHGWDEIHEEIRASRG